MTMMQIIRTSTRSLLLFGAFQRCVSHDQSYLNLQRMTAHTHLETVYAEEATIPSRRMDRTLLSLRAPSLLRLSLLFLAEYWLLVELRVSRSPTDTPTSLHQAKRSRRQICSVIARLATNYRSKDPSLSLSRLPEAVRAVSVFKAQDHTLKLHPNKKDPFGVLWQACIWSLGCLESRAIGLWQITLRA